jgi:flagellar FliL protein
MADEPEADNAPAAAQPAKAGKLKKIVLLVLPVLLLGGGAGWWFLRPAPAEAKEEEEVSLEALGVLPMDAFLVNLTDEGGNRFLKATIQLVFETQEDADLVKESEPLKSHARSVVLELLTEQSAPDLVTAEGKSKLKDAIKTKVSSVLTKHKVVDVLFSEFVVQF